MSVKITSSSNWKVSFWTVVHNLFKKGTFCDLEILCGGASKRDVIRCHAIILAAISPRLAQCLSECQGSATIHLPDYSHQTVHGLIDSLYRCLCGRNEIFSSQDSAHLIQDLVLNLDLVHQTKLENEDNHADINVVSCGYSNDETCGDKNDANNDVGHRDKIEEDNIPMEQIECEEAIFDKCETMDENICLDPVDLCSPDAFNISKKRATNKTKPFKTEKSSNRSCQTQHSLQSEAGSKAAKKALPEEAPKLDIEDLIRKMSMRGSAFEVRLLKKPFDIVGCYSTNFMKRTGASRTSFEAFVGLKQSNNRIFTALPLSWTCREGAETAEQYKLTCQAFINVLGVTKLDLYYCSSIVYRLGIQNDLPKSYLTVRRRYAKLSDEELMEALSLPAIKELKQSLPPKPFVSTEEDNNLTKIVILDKEVEVDDIEHIGLLSFLPSGQIQLQYILPQTSNNPDLTFGNMLMTKVMDNWCKFQSSASLPTNQSREPILNYKRIRPALLRLKAIEYFQADADGTRRTRSLAKTETRPCLCPHCGIALSDYHALRFHVSRNSVNQNNCDCGIIHKCKTTKENHNIQEHSSEYTKCGRCGHVLKNRGLAQHERFCSGENAEDLKKRLISPNLVNLNAAQTPNKLGSKLPSKEKINCDVCGRKYPVNRAGLHKYQYHKQVKCKLCSFSTTGNVFLRSHMVKSHKEVVATKLCQVCGKKFLSDHSIVVHTRRHHSKGAKHPHKCPHDGCPRTFSYKSEIQPHLLNAHLKTRPFVCRQGCSAAYNSPGSLHTHHRKKHGVIQSVRVKDFAMPNIEDDN